MLHQLVIKNVCNLRALKCRNLSSSLVGLSGAPLSLSSKKVEHPFLCSCCFCSFSTNGVNDGNGKDDNGSEAQQHSDDVLKMMALELELKALKEQLHYQTESAVRKEDPDIAELLANNKKWVATQKQSDPNFFKRVGGPQSPKYLYIGCSDSRVPANEILGLGPGEVFVHRNVGSQVIGSDLNVLSCIEYAVQFLDVRHIIVAGHYDCGAVRAAMKPKDLGLLENWLRSIRDVYRMHHQAIDMYDDEEERHRKLVEYSVVEQCLNLYKTGVVQRKRKETHAAGMQAYPRIHAMVFDPKVGILQKLPINFKMSLGKYRHIYDLY